MRHSIISLLLLLLVITGCSEQYDEEAISKAKAVTRSYIESNYNNIESIELMEPEESPMGSIMVDGTVNGVGFSVSLSSDFSVNSIGENAGFPERKAECQGKDCEF
ncbi:hypothetical protein SFC02_16250 [Terribacillus goriensis]|uniref:hypothetical protein n=1 Tax=Terribacillus saccharophilus TaxID=361277 RepID=UPI0039835771